MDRQTIPDWIKGIAITLMVYGHVTHVGSASLLQKSIVGIIYTFHMPLFLIISGFFLNLNSDIFEATHKVFRRIVVPYLFFGSLYLFGLILIQQWGIHTNNAPPISIIDFLEILLIHPRGGYWFLHSLIILQLSILVSRYLISRCKLEESLIIPSIFLIALACKLDLLLTRTAVFFLVGIVLRKFSNVIPASVNSGLLLLLLIAFIGIEDVLVLSLVQVAWVLAMLLFLGGLGIIFSNKVFFSVFVWVGQNSLVILCLHSIFVVISKPLADIFLLPDTTGVMYSIAVTLITVYGYILAARIFDNLHLSRILFGVNELFVKRK